MNGPGNFLAWLAERLDPHAVLQDAASGQVIGGGGAGQVDLGEAIRRAGAAIHGAATRGAGGEPGQAVALLTDLSPSSALAYLGAIHAGFVAIPIDTVHGIDSFPRIAEQVPLAALWAPGEQLLSRIEAGGLPRLHGDLSRGPRGGAADAAPRGPDDLAVLMPTSGSTGRPRLVRVTHGNLVANTADIVHTQHLQRGDRAMLVLPLSYCFGTSVLHSHLAAGGDVVFDRRLMFADKVLAAIRDHGCTSFAGVPTVFRMLLARSSLGKVDLGGLRRWLQAGGPLEPDSIDAVLRAAPGVDFYAMYGQTEATSRISCLDPADLARKRGSAGRPLPALRVRVAPESGEILVAGPSVTQGYWEDPAATAERFGDGWLRTGDLGRLDEDGFLWIEGRIADFIKVAGVRLSLAEVESRIGGMEGVAEAAAAAVPHPEAGEALAIFIVPEPGSDPEALVDAVRRALPRHWLAPVLRTVAGLPMTASGKIARRELAAMAADAAREAA